MKEEVELQLELTLSRHIRTRLFKFYTGNMSTENDEFSVCPKEAVKNQNIKKKTHNDF